MEEESDVPEPEEQPQEGQPREEADSNSELNPINEFHRDDPILDPVHIEYRDSIIYWREPNQTEEQLDADLQQAAMGATCMVCHRCHPLVCLEYFVAPSDRTMICYYILYTCQTPVERNMASGQVSDDAEDFDPQRFCSMRIIQDDGHQEEGDSRVGDRSGNPLHTSEPEEPQVIHYLDDHIEVNYTRTILDFNEEESNRILEEYQDTLCSDIPCKRCEECIPRLVQVYRTDHTTGRTVFSQFAQVCQNLDRIAMNIHTNNGIHSSALHSSNESVADESDSEIPELIDTPDYEGVANMENIPQMNGITYNLRPDLESDEEEFMGQFHSIAPSNCPYCNNCRPQVVVEFFVNFCGEPFTRNQLICQSTGAGSSPSVCAMRMVHSSNV